MSHEAIVSSGTLYQSVKEYDLKSVAEMLAVKKTSETLKPSHKDVLPLLLASTQHSKRELLSPIPNEREDVVANLLKMLRLVFHIKLGELENLVINADKEKENSAATCKNLKKGKNCPIKFCHKFLLTRYGENAEEVAQAFIGRSFKETNLVSELYKDQL